MIVHLEALGAVLRSTALLAAIKRKYPKGHITWITKSPASQLLQNVKDIDRILTTSAEDMMRVSALRFDVVYCIDKSLLACALAASVNAAEHRGFKADPLSGAILPTHPEASELWELGLNNHKKFFENQKSELQLVHEALNLGEFRRDEYVVELSSDEQELARARRREWTRDLRPLIGLNTGCSPVIPYKKMTIEAHRELIRQIRRSPTLRSHGIVLLGGPEDTERNRAIAAGLDVIASPTERGLRDGLCSVEACDVVVSGDSLGLHMAIGLKKWTVAWFGPTCPQEIDLFDRGVKISADVGCAPCWKRVCDKPVMCYDRVNLSQILAGIEKGLEWRNLSSKQLSPETSFSASP